MIKTMIRRVFSTYVRPTKVTLYYDTISPYSWFAFEILMRYRPIWNLNLTLKPVFIGGLSKLNNNSFLDGLKNSSNKVNYFFEDLKRNGDFFQVPINIPESPFYLFGVIGSLQQQRYLIALQKRFPDQPKLLEDASRQLWYRIWSEDMDARSNQSLMIISLRIGLTEQEGLDVIQDTMESSTVKEILKTNTNEANNCGAFGLPYMLINPDKSDREFETYFGSDRFEVMAHKLKKPWKGPVPNPEDFVPLEKAPDQKEIFLNIEDFDRIQKTQKQKPIDPVNLL